jgi:hypothetical protein
MGGRGCIDMDWGEHKREFYSVPNFFKSENPTPKNRMAATGQIDHVMDLFWMRSIPMKKIQRMTITPILNHHFFFPVFSNEMSVMKLSSLS